MPDEVRIFSMLGSWLYGSLIHATGVLGRAFEADLTAVRVFGIKNQEHASFVDTTKLGLSSRHDKTVQSWVGKSESLFDAILVSDKQQGIYRPAELLAEMDTSDAPDTPTHKRLFNGLLDIVDVNDCVCMSMNVYGDIWAAVALMRCQDTELFTEDDLHVLKKIKPAVAHMLRSGCARQGLTSLPSVTRKRGSSVAKRWTTDQIIGKLTRTECQVLGYLRLATTEREISQEVHRSPHTVHVHVKNIYRKLDVSSRGELMELFGDTIRD